VLSAEPLYTLAIALAVAASATGNAVVAWSDTVLGESGYQFVIRAAHFGSTWEPEVTISSPAYSAYYATGFSLHADAQGDFLAAWDEISTAPSAVPTPAWELPAHPGVARYDHRTGWSAAFEPAEPDPGASLWPIPNVWSVPAVAMDADGNAVVAWSDSLRSISGQSGFIRADRYTNDKGWMGTESAAIVANPLTPIQPSVAIDGAGDAVVAWMEGQQRPYASTFHGTWSAAALAAASGYADELGPLVATDTHGGFLAVFSEDDSVSSDLYASRLEIPGSWSLPQKLDAPVSTDADGSSKNLDGGSSVTGEFASSVPALVMNESGDALVTWARTNGTSQSVQAIAFSPGSGWGAPARVLSGPGAYNGSLLIDARGDGMLIFPSGSTDYELAAIPYSPAAGWGSRVTLSSTQAQLGDFSAAMNASGEVAAVWTLDRIGRSAEVVEGAVYR
jgi:hypothetical protein